VGGVKHNLLYLRKSTEKKGGSMPIPDAWIIEEKKRERPSIGLELTLPEARPVVTDNENDEDQPVSRVIILDISPENI
jgi:hypothetical protein